MDSNDRDKLDRIAEGVARIDQKTEGLKEYIVAVSANVEKVRTDLSTHKESIEAHGRKASENTVGAIIGASGLLISIGLLIVEIFRK